MLSMPNNSNNSSTSQILPNQDNLPCHSVQHQTVTNLFDRLNVEVTEFLQIEDERNWTTLFKKKFQSISEKIEGSKQEMETNIIKELSQRVCSHFGKLQKRSRCVTRIY